MKARTRKRPAEKPRERRSKEEARAQILDAAERRLRDAGPAAIRLQDVAADVGISHPAVLHHFESRDGLLTAVVERAIERLQADLARVIGEAPSRGASDGAALFEIVAETLFEKGHARLIAWLLLSGYDPFASPMIRAGWRAIADMTHAARLAATTAKPKPTLEDTDFTIVLSSLALFGQAIAGRATFAAAGLSSEARTEKRFRAWLARLLARHLEGPSLLEA